MSVKEKSLKKYDKLIKQMIDRLVFFDMTYTKLSQISGVSITTIYFAFNGIKMPRIDTFIKLASALGLKLILEKVK